jgi:hypothetical protein
VGQIRCPETSVKDYGAVEDEIDTLSRNVGTCLGAVEDGTDTLYRNVGKGLLRPLKLESIRCPETSVKDYGGR